VSLGSSVSTQQLLYIHSPHRGQAPATLSVASDEKKKIPFINNTREMMNCASDSNLMHLSYAMRCNPEAMCIYCQIH
jgi:hypothetical protein